jgi:hypothetical protein
MREEAAAAGFYVPEFYPDQKCPKIQILTVEEILEGQQVKYPRFADAKGSPQFARDFTFKRARRQQKGKKPTPERLL